MKMNNDQPQTARNADSVITRKGQTPLFHLAEFAAVAGIAAILGCPTALSFTQTRHDASQPSVSTASRSAVKYTELASRIVRLLDSPMTPKQRQLLHAKNYDGLSTCEQSMYMFGISYYLGFSASGQHLSAPQLAERLASSRPATVLTVDNGGRSSRVFQVRIEMPSLNIEGPAQSALSKDGVDLGDFLDNFLSLDTATIQDAATKVETSVLQLSAAIPPQITQKTAVREAVLAGAVAGAVGGNATDSDSTDAHTDADRTVTETVKIWFKIKLGPIEAGAEDTVVDTTGIDTPGAGAAEDQTADGSDDPFGTCDNSDDDDDSDSSDNSDNNNDDSDDDDTSDTGEE